MKSSNTNKTSTLRRSLLKCFSASAVGAPSGFAGLTALRLSIPAVAFTAQNALAADTKRSVYGNVPAELAAAHLINRLGFGPRPGDIATIAKDPGAWIEQQLRPDTQALPVALTNRLEQLKLASTNPVTTIREYTALLEENRQENRQVAAGNQAASQAAMQMNAMGEQGAQAASQTPANLSPRLSDFARPNELGAFIRSHQAPALQSRLWRALESPRQLEEVMVDFWFNHFNVFQGKNLLRVMVGHYEQYAIRPFAMGRFKDLLTATAHHPAMMYYLDNAMSVAPPQLGQASGQGNPNRGLNENYARELMELHTLGVDAGYEQKDVTELARMLTGWTIIPARPRPGMQVPEMTNAAPGQSETMPGFWFNERVHDRGEKVWLGQRITPGGKAEGDFALDFLAKHPATAKNISFKLAQYFVNDRPSAALVDRLAKVFLQEDGKIVPVLRTLFNSPEFWAIENRNAKYKTPYQYTLSALRATGASPNNLQSVTASLAAQGMPLFGCQTPDGYKNTEAAWLNPDGITKRINFASQLATGRMGNERMFPAEVGAAQVIENLGPIISSSTAKAVNEQQSDPSLALALVLASPNMMRR
jgi:uncharacterized protein (DUF1800 family)